MLKSTIRRASIEDLIPYEKNPNQMNSIQKDSLNYSIKTNGLLQLPIIDQDNNIIDGHQRYNVCIEQGIKEIDVIEVEIHSERDKRLLAQAMNKIHGTHNPELDAHDMISILKSGDDEAQNMLELMRMTAQNDEREIFKLLEKYEEDYKPPNRRREENLEDVNLDPEQIEESVTKTGDIWKLGNHYLLCGDCTKKEDVDKLLQGKTVDLLLTDPPYGVDYSGKNEFLNLYDKGNRIQKDIENDNISDYEVFFTDFLKIIPFSDYNIFYVFMSNFALHLLRKALDNRNLMWSDYLVWVKNNHVLGRKDYNSKHEFIVYGWKNHHKFYGDFSTTILEYNKPVSSKLHPVMKPIEMLVKLISDGSLQEMLVYDPFLGSGSTLIACEQTNRICFGIEIDPRYVDVCVERWEKYTGQKAELIK